MKKTRNNTGLNIAMGIVGGFILSKYLDGISFPLPPDNDEEYKKFMKKKGIDIYE